MSEALVIRMGNYIFYSFTVFQTKSNRFISVCAAKRIFCTLYRFTWKCNKIRSENKQNWMESSSSKGALITLCLLKYAFQLNCAANIGSTLTYIDWILSSKASATSVCIMVAKLKEYGPDVNANKRLQKWFIDIQ